MRSTFCQSEGKSSVYSGGDPHLEANVKGVDSNISIWVGHHFPINSTFCKLSSTHQIYFNFLPFT